MTKKLFNIDENPKLLSFLTDVEVVDNIESADIVLFSGTSDVSPSLYGEKKGPTTVTNYKKDLMEKKIYKHLRKNQLAVGIGRGAQFLAVMNGARLRQEIFGHNLRETHPIISSTQYYEITSFHHQSIDVSNMDENQYNILFSSPGRYHDLSVPEIVIFDGGQYAKCLCIQGHPEMMPDQPVSRMLNKLIHDLCE